MRRGHQGRTDTNHAEIVEALRSVSGVTVHSLAGVANGVPDLLVGARGATYLVEVKDGEKTPSRRTLTHDQVRWVKRWTGSAVIILTNTDQARSWARRIAAAPGTHADVLGRDAPTYAVEDYIAAWGSGVA